MSSKYYQLAERLRDETFDQVGNLDEVVSAATSLIDEGQPLAAVEIVLITLVHFKKNVISKVLLEELAREFDDSDISDLVKEIQTL